MLCPYKIMPKTNYYCIQLYASISVSVFSLFLSAPVSIRIYLDMPSCLYVCISQSVQIAFIHLASRLSKVTFPFRTQFIWLWLQFEQRAILEETESSTRKRKVKEMKNSVKKMLEVDRNNVLVYSAFAQTLLRVESYQVSRT